MKRLTVVPKPEEPEPDDLSARHDRAIVALLGQPTLAGAAREAGIGERTLRRWLHEDDAFRAAYRDARSAALAHATGCLRAASARAVETLTELMGQEEKPEVRARAAMAVLTLGLKAEELDLADRMDAIERRLDRNAGSAVGDRPWPGVRA